MRTCEINISTNLGGSLGKSRRAQNVVHSAHEGKARLDARPDQLHVAVARARVALEHGVVEELLDSAHLRGFMRSGGRAGERAEQSKRHDERERERESRSPTTHDTHVGAPASDARGLMARAIGRADAAKVVANRVPSVRLGNETSVGSVRRRRRVRIPYPLIVQRETGELARRVDRDAVGVGRGGGASARGRVDRDAGGVGRGSRGSARGGVLHRLWGWCGAKKFAKGKSNVFHI